VQRGPDIGSSNQFTHIKWIMTLDLARDEAHVPAKHLRCTLDDDPYPLAPGLDPLGAILANAEPPAPRPELPRPVETQQGPNIPS
jgi:hypothetical protein